MNTKRKKICKVILISFSILFLLLISSNSIINKIYFDPHKDIIRTASLFSAATQLLTPSITGNYINATLIDANPFQEIFRFSCYTEKFYVKKYVPGVKEYDSVNKGYFNYHFGKISISNYQNDLNIDPLTTDQAIFINKPVQSPEFSWNEIDPDTFYEIWFRFLSPKTLQEIKEDYGPLVTGMSNGPLQSGVNWIPVKSSDNPKDVCIGICGNYSMHYFNDSDFRQITKVGSDIQYPMKPLFSTLEYLIENEKDATMFLECGLYPEAENIDFKSRYAYLKEKGVKCLGMVTYIKGDFLQSHGLEKDNSLEIVKVANKHKYQEQPDS